MKADTDLVLCPMLVLLLNFSLLRSLPVRISDLLQFVFELCFPSFYGVFELENVQLLSHMAPGEHAQ